MARVLVWNNLTPAEEQTLAALEASGKQVFPAPIEIEHYDQLKDLGISRSRCRVWRIGTEKVTVYLTPADEQTYKFLLNELRKKHRNAHRERRCKIPGKHPGTLICCPECNKCTECPHPECRDAYAPGTFSLDVMLENGNEGGDTRMMDQLHAKLEYEDIERMMNRENPLISKAFRMKVLEGLSADEIAQELGITKRTVYYYLDRAKAIGQEYYKES